MYLRLTVIFLQIFIFTCCIKENTEPSTSYVQLGSPLPEFILSGPNKTNISSISLKGKVVLIVFFSTLCGDCQKELPVVEELWKEMEENSNFVLLPISRKQNIDEVTDYWNKNHFSMPYYSDKDGEVYSLFATHTVPRFYLANKEGIVSWTETEKLTINVEEIKAKITALL